jgi:hypothetical protein
MSDEKKTKEAGELKIIYVGNDDGECLTYVLATTEQEAVDLVLANYGDDVEDYGFDVVVLGPAPSGLVDSGIMDGLLICSDCSLISWLLERLQETEKGKSRG